MSRSLEDHRWKGGVCMAFGVAEDMEGAEVQAKRVH